MLASAFSRQSLTAEVRAQPQAVPCGIYGAQSGNVTGVSPSTSFPLSVHSTRGSGDFLNIYMTLNFPGLSLRRVRFETLPGR